MNVKRFTSEELAILRENPYTYKATPAQLKLTAEFKERFWSEYNKGILPKEILRECGYDPEMLGDSRINGILLHIRETASRGEEFRTENRPRTPKIRTEDCAPKSPDEEIKQLRSELKYIRKEVEFLKKISSARTSKRQVKS